MLQKVVICGVDTSGLPLLSNKEQEELMIKLKAGDEKARERFIVGICGWCCHSCAGSGRKKPTRTTSFRRVAWGL